MVGIPTEKRWERAPEGSPEDRRVRGSDGDSPTAKADLWPVGMVREAPILGTFSGLDTLDTHHLLVPLL